MTLIIPVIRTTTIHTGPPPPVSLVSPTVTEFGQARSNALAPVELYIARRSTEASHATARSALNAASRILGHDRFEQMDWAIGYHEAALIRAGVNRLGPG